MAKTFMAARHRYSWPTRPLCFCNG